MCLANNYDNSQFESSKFVTQKYSINHNAAFFLPLKVHFKVYRKYTIQK